MMIIAKIATHPDGTEGAASCPASYPPHAIKMMRPQGKPLRRYSVGSSLAGPAPVLRSNLGCRAVPDGLMGPSPFRSEGRVV